MSENIAFDPKWRNKCWLHSWEAKCLGLFVKLWKVSIIFIIQVSVCPSVCMQQLGSHWMDFHEILYLSIFFKSFMKIQFSLKSDKNNGTSYEDRYVYIYGNSLLISS